LKNFVVSFILVILGIFFIILGFAFSFYSSYFKLDFIASNLRWGVVFICWILGFALILYARAKFSKNRRMLY
jgi:hypothetical protein